MKVLYIPPDRMFADSGCRPEESLDAMTAECSSQSKRVIRDRVKILMESLVKMEPVNNFENRRWARMNPTPVCVQRLFVSR